MIPLIKVPRFDSCTVIERVNRFVVRVESENGKEHRAHINNTGRLEEFFVPGRRAFTFPTPHTGRTDRRLFAFQEPGAGALIDTQFQMKAFERALERGALPWLKACGSFRRNARLDSSLIDYLLTCGEEKIFLEVKSAVMREGSFATYPDCPSTRGQKHVRHLTEWARNRGTAKILFVAALPGVEAFKPNAEADPVLAELLIRAAGQGVDVRAVSLVFRPADGYITLTNPALPVQL